MNFQLEIIGFSIEACITAQSAGAHRIELCDNPGEGGTTPSYGFIKAAREKLQIELYPIIRPRGGDFFYSEDDFEIMKTDVKVCKELGCDGVVIGILNTDGTIDKKRCRELVQFAYPMGVTFHRAFDRVADAAQAMEDVIDIGCERILTAGLLPNALDGATTIAQLIEQANGRIIIMPGSGVRADNIAAIAQKTGATEFHSSAKILIKSKMEFNSIPMNEKLQLVTVDAAEIKNMIESLINI